MNSLKSREDLSSQQLARVDALWSDVWELIQNIIVPKTDRILLPWFRKGIRWNSEIGQYGLESTRQTFSKSLIVDAQMEYFLWILDEYEIILQGIKNKVMVDLLGMNTTIGQPYFIEGTHTWQSRIWLSKKHAHEFFLWNDGKVKYQEIREKEDRAKKAYKIRLQAD